MKLNPVLHYVEMARFCCRNGFPVTADVHMRNALREANRLQRRDVTAAIFRIRNKLRPHVMRATAPRATVLN